MRKDFRKYADLGIIRNRILTHCLLITSVYSSVVSQRYMTPRFVSPDRIPANPCQVLLRWNGGCHCEDCSILLTYRFYQRCVRHSGNIPYSTLPIQYQFGNLLSCSALVRMPHGEINHLPIKNFSQLRRLLALASCCPT